MGKLRHRELSRQRIPGKYCDGDGLYLIIARPSSGSWAYRYWFKGKERWHGLGSLNDVSLKAARVKRDEARQRVRAGVDLVQEKRLAREEAKATSAIGKPPSFQQSAEKYIDQHWTKWSAKERAEWPSALRIYAYPTIGSLTIAQIKPSHILELLKSIWVHKRELAKCLRCSIKTIIASADIDDPHFRNPAELTKQLRQKLRQELKPS